MPAKPVDRFTAKLVDCFSAKHVDPLNCFKLMNRLTAKWVDRLTAKLVVVNLVKLHWTKLKMYVNAVTLKALTSNSDAESITSTFLVSLLKLKCNVIG